jgi:hypothetical protein
MAIEHILKRRELKLRQAELRQRSWELQYQAKGESERVGFRGLVFINGGAAVALGALLQAIIGKEAARPMCHRSSLLQLACSRTRSRWTRGKSCCNGPHR